MGLARSTIAGLDRDWAWDARNRRAMSGANGRWNYALMLARMPVIGGPVRPSEHSGVPLSRNEA